MKTTAVFCNTGYYILLQMSISNCVQSHVHYHLNLSTEINLWRIGFDMVHRMIAQSTSKLRQLLVTLFYHQHRGHPGFSVSLFAVLPLTAATFLYHLTKLASEAQEQPSVRPAVCSKVEGCVAWLRVQQLILFGNRCAPCSQQKHLFLCVVSNIVFLW